IDDSPAGFEWLIGDDTRNSVVAFLRRGTGTDHPIAAIINFSGVPHHGYRVGLPAEGEWDVLLNTDAHAYGGSGVGDGSTLTATAVPSHGHPASAELSIPPLGALFLAPKS